jgi:hypothetical protein
MERIYERPRRALQRAYGSRWTRVALMKEQARQSREAYSHYDTQNTKNKLLPPQNHIHDSPPTQNYMYTSRSRLCRNETVKPLPPARLLSKQGSRRRSGLVVFPFVKQSWFNLRPGRGTVSYWREQTVTDVTSGEGAVLWSRRCVVWFLEPELI